MGLHLQFRPISIVLLAAHWQFMIADSHYITINYHHSSTVSMAEVTQTDTHTHTQMEFQWAVGTAITPDFRRLEKWVSAGGKPVAVAISSTHSNREWSSVTADAPWYLQAGILMLAGCQARNDVLRRAGTLTCSHLVPLLCTVHLW